MEAESRPTTCNCCGSDEIEANPFDARCPGCGQGYFQSDKPNFCAACGTRLTPEPPKPKVKSIRIVTQKSKPPARPARRSSSGLLLKYALYGMLLAALAVGVGMAAMWVWPYVCSACVGIWEFLCAICAGVWSVICTVCSWIWAVIMFIWAVICFIFRHWIISSIVLLIIIVKAKS